MDFSFRDIFFVQKEGGGEGRGKLHMHMSDHDFDGFDDLCTPCGGGKEKTRKGCGSRMFCGRREGKKNEREVLWPVVIFSTSPGGVDCNGVFLSLVLLILLCYYPS